MTIGFVCSDEEYRTNAVLDAVADRARRAGIALAGTTQPVDPAIAHEKCTIVLALLPDGVRRNVSFDLTAGTTGCRLDAAALEEAVMIVHDRLPAAEGLIVNKFGKQEATGRGLVAAIVEAYDRGLPVLVGVSPQWCEAFLAFAGERASALPADEEAIFDWLRDACRPAEAEGRALA